jgi:oligopeptide transport system ATP-binding protein
VALFEIDDLEVRFDTPDGMVCAVNGVSLALERGECVGVVGESGSGKSQLFLAALGLLARNGRLTGSVRYRGEELVGLAPARFNRLRGDRLAMIFQDSMTGLTPHLRIARQMTEVLVQHKGMAAAAARQRARQMLDLVRIPDADRRLDQYPHELSGGMRQRVMIAMALLCEPEVLIADEPTTALDVTVQAQILELMADLKRDSGAAIVLITHDLGVVAGLCDRVQVMYAGRFVETGPTGALFARPQHPYTVGLLGSVPRLDERRRHNLSAIPGHPPDLQRLPPGCAYEPRCPWRFERCTVEEPLLRPVADQHAPDQAKACHLDAPPEVSRP